MKGECQCRINRSVAVQLSVRPVRSKLDILLQALVAWTFTASPVPHTLYRFTARIFTTSPPNPTYLVSLHGPPLLAVPQPQCAVQRP